MNSLLQDLRFALRQLRKSPGFTTVAVATLALGIGASTAMFNVVETVVLRPLPFRSSDQLVWLNGKLPQTDEAAVSPPDFVDYRAGNHSFEQLAAMGFRGGPSNLIGDRTEQVITNIASANFFSCLGIRPLLGRDFLPADEQVSSGQVAILGFGVWKRDFGADPDIVGRKIRLDGQDLTVVGVLPTDLPLLTEAQIWLPMPLLNDRMRFRLAHFLKVIGRLKPGMTMQQSQADLDAIAAVLARQYPDTNKGWSLRQRSLAEVLIGPVRSALLMIWAAAGLLLLIACANLTNLVLTRSIARQREFAVCTALGASRERMIQRAMTETLILGMAGGALGAFTARWGVYLLRAYGPSTLPRLPEIHIHAPVLAFALAMSLLTGTLLGLVPMLQFSQAGLSESLKESGRMSASAAHKRLRCGLVVAEFAISLTLLVAAGLLIKSFWLLIHVNPGFQAEHVFAGRLSLNGPAYDDAAPQVRFWQELEEKIAHLPGVEAVGATSELPLSGESGDNPFHIPGRSYGLSEFDDAFFRQVTPGYLRAMRIPLMLGRWLDQRDTAKSPGSILVNQAFAEHFFPGQHVLGKRLQLMGDPQSTREIVGIVGNISHTALSDPQRPEMYVPYAQYPIPTMHLIVRATANSSLLTTALNQAISSIDKDVTLSAVRSLDDAVDSSVSQTRFWSFLLGSFAVVALMLAATGLYGVMAYSATQRTREIGIRIAMGAKHQDVLKMIVLQGMKLASTGLVIGIVASLALTRLLTHMLYQVKPADPLTFVLVSFCLLGVALLANCLPARRAAKVDPMVALRYE